MYYTMPSCELNKEVKMVSDTESCTAEREAESDDEVYVEAEKTYSRVHLMPKRKTKAFVWKYFGFEADRDSRPLCVDLPNFCRVLKPHNSCSERFKYIKPVQPPEN